MLLTIDQLHDLLAAFAIEHMEQKLEPDAGYSRERIDATRDMLASFAEFVQYSVARQMTGMRKTLDAMCSRTYELGEMVERERERLLQAGSVAAVAARIVERDAARWGAPPARVPDAPAVVASPAPTAPAPPATEGPRFFL